jgi:hypothetical protein
VALFPFAQLPNAPLVVALGGLLVAALTDGSIARLRACRVLRRPRGVGVGGTGRRRELGAPRARRRALVYFVVKVGAAIGA